MFKHLKNKYDNINLERNNKIIDYDICTYNAIPIKKPFSPNNMNNNNYNNQFIVLSNDQNIIFPIFYAFNHTNENYITQINNNPINLYFNFHKKRNLQYIKFNLHDVYYAFNISLYGSDNYDQIKPQNSVWIKLDECNIGLEENIENINNLYYFNNKSRGDYLQGNLIAICKFEHTHYYKYYKLKITSNELQTVKISKMKLYDQDSYNYPWFYFPFNDSYSDFENEIEVNSYSMNLEENYAVFNINSSLKIPAFFISNMNQYTVLFDAYFNADNLIGTIFSQNNFNFAINNNLQDEIEFVISINDENYSFNISKTIIHNKWASFKFFFGEKIIIYINDEIKFQKRISINHVFPDYLVFGENLKPEIINYISNMKLRNLSIYDYEK